MLTGLSLPALLEELAAPREVPGAGSALAAALAAAAAVVQMAARLSPDSWADADGVWRCRTVFNCVEACPRGINVTRAILEVTQEIKQAGRA